MLNKPRHYFWGSTLLPVICCNNAPQVCLRSKNSFICVYSKTLQLSYLLQICADLSLQHLSCGLITMSESGMSIKLVLIITSAEMLGMYVLTCLSNLLPLKNVSLGSGCMYPTAKGQRKKETKRDWLVLTQWEKSTEKAGYTIESDAPPRGWPLNTGWYSTCKDKVCKGLKINGKAPVGWMWVQKTQMFVDFRSIESWEFKLCAVV